MKRRTAGGAAFLRTGMQFVAGLLVANGHLSEDMATQLVGGVVSIATVGWFYWAKKSDEIDEAGKGGLR